LLPSSKHPNRLVNEFVMRSVALAPAVGLVGLSVQVRDQLQAQQADMDRVNVIVRDRFECCCCTPHGILAPLQPVLMLPA
jgi:hypothetical protein